MATTKPSEDRPHRRGCDAPNNQADRQRVLDALAQSISEVGYADTTVADVARRARASLRTFYQFFADREAALVALIGQANDEIIARSVAAVDTHAEWKIQIRQAVEAWIQCAESRPSLMVSWIRDVPALGLAARDLQARSTESYIAMIQSLTNSYTVRDDGIAPVSRTRAIMLIGGLNELTASTVERGEQLSALTDEIVEAAIAILKPSNLSIDR